MYVREKPCVFARNCLASKQGRGSSSCPGPRSPAALWVAACLGQDRFIRPTLRYIQSCALLAIAASARRRPQRPGCVAAALPARGNQRSQPRRGDGNGLARGAQGPAHDARQSPPGADSVLGGGETAAEQLETGLQRLQYTDQLHCDEVEALVCGIARNTPHLHRTRWKTLIAFVTRQNHHH